MKKKSVKEEKMGIKKRKAGMEGAGGATPGAPKLKRPKKVPSMNKVALRKKSSSQE